MAFNPFHSFRKHSKVIFAILTIICMFTFILSGGFGKADAFEWFLSLFGAGRSQGKLVTTLYGDKVYEGQISDRSRSRQIANDFALKAVAIGIGSTGEDVAAHFARSLTADNPGEELERYYRTIQVAYFEMLFGRRLQPTEEISKLLQRDQQRPEVQAKINAAQRIALDRLQLAETDRALFLSNLGTQIRVLRSIGQSLKSKGLDTEARVTDGLISMLNFDIWMRSDRDARSTLIFGGSTKRQDILDFMVWLKQADLLGIKLTDSDIRAAVNRLSPSRPILTGKKIEDQKMMEKLFPPQESRYIDLKDIYRGLGDELRVALAQGIILGEEPGLLGTRQTVFQDPLSITPLDYVDYFREQQQTAKVVLLPVPVRSFLTKDLPVPSERQLEEFFDTYKSEEPRPTSSSPAFKEPQRVRLQWVSTRKLTSEAARKAATGVPLAGFATSLEDARREYYEDRAKAQFRIQIASSVGQSPLAFPATWFAETSLNQDAQGYLIAARAFDNAYASLKRDASSVMDGSYFKMPSLLKGDPALSLYTAMNLRTVIASTVGHANPGALGQLGAALTAQGAAAIRGKEYQEDYIKEERTKRSRMVAGLLGSSLNPSTSASTLWTPLAPWFWAESEEEPIFDTNVPMQALKFQIMQRALNRKAAELEQADLDQFQKKLTDSKGDPEAARKIIDEYVKKMHLESSIGESQFDDDRYSLSKDPGLKPMVEFWDSSTKFDPRATLEGMVFQSGTALYTPDEIRLNQPDGVALLVYWKTKNEPARTHELKDQGVRDEVIRAWQFLEARKIARKEAEKISEAITGKSDKDVQKVLDELLSRHPDWGKLITLDQVSRQRRLPQQPFKDVVYEKFKIDPDDIAHPTAGFVDSLLKLNEAQASVMKDRPEKSYYVAYVMKKMGEPTVADALLPANRGNMWDAFRSEQRKERLQSLLLELRRQAAAKGQLNAQNRFVLEPGIPSDESTVE
jgi:hypothetical protein